MRNSAYQQEIHDRLRGKHLIPIFTSSLNIPERVREIDPSFFIVLNVKKQRYEVHSLDNKGDTYCFFVSMNELDGRIIKKIYQNSIKVRGAAVFKEMDKHNKAMEKSRERERMWQIKDAAGEMQKPLSKIAWGEING